MPLGPGTFGRPANDHLDLQIRHGGGNSGGMDPWKQAVEARLGDLRSDYRGVAADVSTLKSDISALKENVRHLPSKGYIIAAVSGAVALVAALLTIQTLVQTFVLPKPAAAVTSTR